MSSRPIHVYWESVIESTCWAKPVNAFGYCLKSLNLILTAGLSESWIHFIACAQLRERVQLPAHHMRTQFKWVIRESERELRVNRSCGLWIQIACVTVAWGCLHLIIQCIPITLVRGQLHVGEGEGEGLWIQIACVTVAWGCLYPHMVLRVGILVWASKIQKIFATFGRNHRGTPNLLAGWGSFYPVLVRSGGGCM